MGRPLRNNCEYFPHLTTMRNHRKIKALRNKFGSILGYAFWSMFLEYLTELDGNEFEFNTIECEMFAAELGISAAEIPPLLNYCIEIELLFKEEINGKTFIHSDSLNDRLNPVYEKRNKERDKSKARKRRENGVFDGKNTTSGGITVAETPPQCGLTAEETPQSKVKQSKLYKENIKKDENGFLMIFDDFRKLYPGTKRGNETEFENFKKKHTDWKEVLPTLKSIIENQIEKKQILKQQNRFVPEWKNLQTWINGRFWEEIINTKPDTIIDFTHQVKTPSQQILK